MKKEEIATLKLDFLKIINNKEPVSVLNDVITQLKYIDTDVVIDINDVPNLFDTLGKKDKNILEEIIYKLLVLGDNKNYNIRLEIFDIKNISMHLPKYYTISKQDSEK